MKSRDVQLAIIMALLRLWGRYPEQRFGQLITNLTRDEEGEPHDPWHWTNEAWLKRINEYP